MRIGILGTGAVARTLGAALAVREHEVTLGSRDPAAALARDDVSQQTGTTLAGWHETNPAVRIATFEEAAADGEILVNATAGQGSLSALAAAGDASVDGKVIVDVANPLTTGEQGVSLIVSNTDSLAEQIQRQHAGAKVVKALNTVTAAVMVDPALVGDGDHTLPICGNDDDAKQQVAGWLGDWFGWRDVLDLGDLSGARAMEGYLLLWLRVLQATGTPIFNVKVVR